MADELNLNELYFHERWGPLPRKSPVVLSLLANLATSDRLIAVTPERWAELWALGTSTK